MLRDMFLLWRCSIEGAFSLELPASACRHLKPLLLNIRRPIRGLAWCCLHVQLVRPGRGYIMQASGAEARTAAAQVLGLDGRVLRQVACGWRHSVVVDVDGTVFTFGWSKYGQLGHGDCQCAPPAPLSSANRVRPQSAQDALPTTAPLCCLPVMCCAAYRACPGAALRRVQVF